jgi:ligand-binding sensor protein
MKNTTEVYPKITVFCPKKNKTTKTNCAECDCFGGLKVGQKRIIIVCKNN